MIVHCQVTSELLHREVVDVAQTLLILVPNTQAFSWEMVILLSTPSDLMGLPMTLSFGAKPFAGVPIKGFWKVVGPR
jgi:hypothetical protein